MYKLQKLTTEPYVLERALVAIIRRELALKRFFSWHSKKIAKANMKREKNKAKREARRIRICAQVDFMRRIRALYWHFDKDAVRKRYKELYRIEENRMERMEQLKEANRQMLQRQGMI